ncbi:MAG: undecaprenyldiphospho-muramoylpentapeptide beta-N-acetylglucosaminyltransferase [Acidobacteriia bacterium]|nr:undecaprenyldiphospho-muramoylpentapeptide beta-N-acetylglucosaminyltransferase [Terriglobia bacterium]
MTQAGKKSWKLLIAGGGTGGHVFPALAIAREWMSRGTEREVLFVGTQRGLESRLVPEAGFPLETIRSAGLKGIGGMRLARNVAKLAPAMWDSFAILRKHKFCAALGVGGYAAGPMMLAAVLRGLPTVVFEPNAEPGFTNRILARMATRIATAYEAPTKLWGAKATLTGIPVRPEFFAIAERAPSAPFHILITGGSQGALVINRTLVDAADLLAAKKHLLSIVHQTGERDYNAVRVAYARREINAEVLPFIGNMAERFAQADLIVCRAGAITAAEVAAAGRAAIFIPFGASTDSHQLRNAQEMERQGAARLIPEPQLTAERLTQEIFSLLDAPADLQAMAANARRLSRPRAVQEIVDMVEGIRAPLGAGQGKAAQEI